MRKKFKPSNYKGNYVMHCSTMAQAQIFCDYLKDNYDLNIPAGEQPVSIHYKEYETLTCYDFNKGYYGLKQVYEENDYKILKFEDFRWEDTLENVITKKEAEKLLEQKFNHKFKII